MQNATGCALLIGSEQLIKCVRCVEHANGGHFFCNSLRTETELDRPAVDSSLNSTKN